MLVYIVLWATGLRHDYADQDEPGTQRKQDLHRLKECI